MGLQKILILGPDTIIGEIVKQRICSFHAFAGVGGASIARGTADPAAQPVDRRARRAQSSPRRSPGQRGSAIGFSVGIHSRFLSQQIGRREAQYGGA